MNTLGARISDVNQVAQQLLGSDNRSKEQIDQTQNQLNNRYSRQHKEQTDHIQSYHAWSGTDKTITQERLTAHRTNLTQTYTQKKFMKLDNQIIRNGLTLLLPHSSLKVV